MQGPKRFPGFEVWDSWAMGLKNDHFVIALSGFGEYVGFRNHGESNGKENGKCHGPCTYLGDLRGQYYGPTFPTRLRHRTPTPRPVAAFWIWMFFSKVQGLRRAPRPQTPKTKT